MKTSAYLWKNRHGIWYFRAVIPTQLRLHFPLNKREIRRSLSTDSRQRAVVLARRYRVAFDELFEQLAEQSMAKRKTIQTGLVKGLVLTSGDSTLKVDEIKHDDPAQEQETIKELTKMLEASIQPAQASQNPTKPDSPPLSELFEIYAQEKTADGSWLDKTAFEIRTAVDGFIRIVGDIPASLLAHEHANGYKQTMMALPANINKIAAYRDKSIDEILALPGIKPMSATTVRNRMIKVGGFIKWCVLHGHATSNPLGGIAPGKRGRKSDQRKQFSDKDLQSIFSGYIYVGDFPSRSKPLEYQFWVPLLAAFSGARLEELCQLHVSDIRQVDGIWCIDINEEIADEKQHGRSSPEKKLKTASSQRAIPIHRQLVAIGFLKFVEQQKEAQQVRLFHELRKRRDGYGQDVSRWFGVYRKTCGILTGEKKTFHSFRHVALDNLKQQGIPSEKIAGIAGHEHGSITLDRYGKVYNPAALVDAVNAIHYPGLDLLHVDFGEFMGRVSEFYRMKTGKKYIKK